MYNWDPFAVLMYITGSPVVHIALVLLLIFFGIPNNNDVEEDRNYTIKFMLSSHILCFSI